MRAAVAILALLGMASPSVAQEAVAPVVDVDSACLDRLRAEVPRLPPTLSAMDRRAFQSLREAAILFARRGDEPGCETIVLEIIQLVEDVGIAEDRPEADAVVPPGTELVDIAGAGMIRLGELIGADLEGLGDDELGEVVDVAIGPDRRAYLLVDRDEDWLSLGAGVVVVPLDLIKAAESREELIIDTTGEIFDGMPLFAADELVGPETFLEAERSWDAVAE